MCSTVGSPEHPSGTPSPSSSGGTTHKPVRRRNRVINSCLECRKRKLRCSRDQPCVACTKHQRKCVFLDGALDSVGLHKLTEIKNRVGSLEDLLTTEVAAHAYGHGHSDHSTNASARSSALSSMFGDVEGPTMKEEDLQLNMAAIPEALYEHDVEDELSDLGLQVGMLRINERVGGLFRPGLTREFDRVLAQSGAHMRFSPGPPASPYPTERILPSANLFASSWLSPTTTPLGAMPNQQEARLLLIQYWTCVDPMAHILHKPTFDQQYAKLQRDVSQGIHPTNSTLALIYAVFFVAAVSLPQRVAHLQFGLTKPALLEKFRIMAEQALTRSNFLRTSKMETLQAFTIYLIPQCRTEVSRAHSALVASLIRLAEGISLHRDNESSGMGFRFNPLELHLRRLLWHQICFLDIKTVEIHGPKPAIRDDEFTTKLPLNVDDAAVGPNQPEPLAVQGWTNATFTLIRYECYEAHRLIFQERTRSTMALPQIRAKLEEKKRHIEQTYLQFLDDSVPIQRCARMVAKLLLARLNPMLLQRYVPPDMSRAEPRLKNKIFLDGLEIMESGMALETEEALSPWAWYAGAYQQYHCILFMITEVQRFPQSPFNERIWRVMDYVFGTSTDISREERAKDIVVFLKEKFDHFIYLRRVRLDEHSAAEGVPMDTSWHSSQPVVVVENWSHSHQQPPNEAVAIDWVSKRQWAQTSRATVVLMNGQEEWDSLAGTRM